MFFHSQLSIFEIKRDVIRYESAAGIYFIIYLNQTNFMVVYINFVHIIVYNYMLCSISISWCKFRK